MIRKMLLVRLKAMRSDLLDRAGLTPFVKGEALPVRPMAWTDEDGLSHYGFVLDGLKLADWQALQAWEKQQPAATVLDVGEKGKPIDDKAVTAALASVGLQINESAE